MPLRGDYETEYENDAELMIADMEFRPEDTKWEKYVPEGYLGVVGYIRDFLRVY